MLSLNDSAGRTNFLRHLYNLLQLELYQDQEIREAILDLNRRIGRQLKESMHTDDENTGGRRASTGSATGSSNRAGEGGGDDRAQLRARGYEVKPEVVVDDSGGEWAPLFKVPATFFYSFAVLTLDPRGRIIFSLCIDPWTRTRNSSRRKFGRIRTSSRCSDFLTPFH